MSSALATEEVVQRFLDRLADRIDPTDPELDPGEHRRWIAERFAARGELDHYSFLDLPWTATDDEIQAAFDRVARLVHPAQAARLGLNGREAIFEALFEQATEAYLTLSEPGRRKRYSKTLPVESRPPAAAAPGGALAESERRAEEEKAAAELQARAERLAAAEEFHYAIQLVRQAIALHPKAESWALLGRIQARNPRWLHMAADSFRQAIRLAPSEAAYKQALEEIQAQREETAD